MGAVVTYQYCNRKPAKALISAHQPILCIQSSEYNERRLEFFSIRDSPSRHLFERPSGDFFARSITCYMLEAHWGHTGVIDIMGMELLRAKHPTLQNQFNIFTGYILDRGDFLLCRMRPASRDAKNALLAPKRWALALSRFRLVDAKRIRLTRHQPA